MDVGHIGATDFAGRATVSGDERAHDRCDRRTAKSCRPGARGLCAKSCGDVAAQPGTRIDHLRGDGGNSATLPGESTTYAVPTTAQGRPSVRLHLYAAVQPLVAQPFAQWTVGARPAPGLPCALFQSRVRRRCKARAKYAARMRRRVRHSPSLRGALATKQSRGSPRRNPGLLPPSPKGFGGQVAAPAMTEFVETPCFNGDATACGHGTPTARQPPPNRRKRRRFARRRASWFRNASRRSSFLAA